MKKNKKELTCILMVMGFLLMLAYSCKDTEKTVPILTTSAVSSITTNAANCGGNITGGCSKVTVRGVCWSLRPSPTIADSKTSDGSGQGSFSSTITGLISDTTYYVRAYANNCVGTGYGNTVTFTTVH